MVREKEKVISMGVIKTYTGINVIMEPIRIIKTKERKYIA